MSDYLTAACLPLMFGAFTLVAAVVCGLALGAARHWKLPNSESVAVAPKLAGVVLVNPLAWPGVWVVGMPLYLILKHWG